MKFGHRHNSPHQKYIGGRIIVRLVLRLTIFDSNVSLHTNTNIFSSLTKSDLVKLETGCTTLILPPTVSVLCPHYPLTR